MMMTNHPITPPPELVKQWLAEPEYVSGWHGECTLISITDHRFNNICAKAAQWGADQELEACCADVHTTWGKGKAEWLRSMRRAKPPSLKEQALTLLDDASDRLDAVHENTIRRALEALDD
jgi:hypothetical protein